MKKDENIERTHRKVERTPEEAARPRAAREKLQADRPALDELISSGAYGGPMPLGVYLDEKSPQRP